MVELDRLVKLLVEKMLRSSKKPEPSESGTDEEKAAGHKPQERVSEEDSQRRNGQKNA